MNVLIIGGSGFLGTYVASALLARGHDVTSYDMCLQTSDLRKVEPKMGHRTVLGSLDDLERLNRHCNEIAYDAIVHLVAKVGFESSLANPQLFYQTNVMGMVAACELAKAHSIPRLIAASSSSVYHHSAGTRFVETDAPFSIVHANPQGHYGTSKMASEAIGMAYAEFHGIDFKALRISAIYGFGMRAAVHVKPFVEGAVLERPVHMLTGGRMKRDYIHVLDVARAIALTLESPTTPSGSPRVMNISSGELRSAADVVSIVREVLPGSDITVGDELSPLEANNLKTRKPLDNTLARDLLGWTPKWTLETGLKQYVSAFSEFSKTQS